MLKFSILDYILLLIKFLYIIKFSSALNDAGVKYHTSTYQLYYS
jgi:hypothetical protein